MNLRDLDVKSYSDKVRLFSQDKPWEAKRRRASSGETREERVAKGEFENYTVPMRNKAEFGWYDVKTDRAGNVTSMPLLVGRPCFGIITARLRHGSLTDIIIKRGRQIKAVQSRCGRCTVHDACHRLVDERIKSSPDIEGVVKRWNSQGGRNIFKTNNTFHSARGCWTSLVHTAQKTLFTSQNDHAVTDYWIADQNERLEKDRLRKIAERYKARQRGFIDMDLLKQALTERNRRISQLENARKHSNPPYWVTKLNDMSSAVIANAWFTQFILRTTLQTSNPSCIATKLIARRQFRNFTYGSLRERLKNDLVRVDQLEHIQMNGQANTIWMPFIPN